MSSLTASPNTPLIKIVLIGDMGVGKSCLMRRFLDNEFALSFSTVGADYRQKVVQMKGKTIRLQIFDTAGQERFFAITKAYYRNAHGVLLVYDITSAESLNHILRWANELETTACSAQKILVGNKCDLEETRVISIAKAREVADKFGYKLVEASAKSGINVEQVFMVLLEDILKKIAPESAESDTISTSKIQKEIESEKCNC